MNVPLPANEEMRQAVVESLASMDTPTEPPFEDLVRIASALFRAPIAFVSLVDGERLWFKAICGLDVDQVPREDAFCAHTVALGEPLIVPDLSKDERFADHPLVSGEPFLRFYAGAPLIIDGEFTVGTFCVLDTLPRGEFGDDDANNLRALASLAVNQLEQETLQAAIADGTSVIVGDGFKELYRSTPAMLHSIGRDGCIVDVSDYWLDKLGYSRDEVVGRMSVEFLDEPSRDRALKEVLPAFFESGFCENVPYTFIAKDGTPRDVRLTATALTDDDGKVLMSLAVLHDLTDLNIESG